MTKQIVKVGVPTLTCYTKLIRLCHHLLNDEHPCIEARVFILDNGGNIEKNGTIDALKESCPEGSWKAMVAPYNFGVSVSWNFFLKNLGQCIIANDDVVFGLDDVAVFLREAQMHPEAMIIETNHPVGGFSTFYANRPEEWLGMGGFDELLSPAYFEDNDCRWRLAQAGNPVRKVDLPSWSHDNSSTLHSGDERYKRMHWCCFERNRAYYQLKWGGSPGGETFSTPFNKG